VLEGIRAFGRFGLAMGLGMLAVGVAGVLVAVVAAGDWWQAREPLIGWGLSLSVGGLIVTPPFALLRVAVEPIGWLRALVVIPVAILAFGWLVVLVGGVGPVTGHPDATGGPYPPAYPIQTVLYNRVGIFMLLVIGSAAVALPLVAARFRGGD
jgi:hypothetical protein